MTDLEQRVRDLEQQVADLKRMVAYLDQKVADEHCERVAAYKRAMRQQQDREWMRECA